MLLSAWMRRLLLAACAAAFAAPAPALASDPMMALADVQPGARCTGLTVVHATTISSFDVKILDVIDRQRGPEGARLLIRVSGPAIEPAGLGPGFSGSPILCPGADGVPRNAGAISETIGEYGGRTALATPIEAILAQPLQPPIATPRAIVGARPLAGPLTIAGLRPSLASDFVKGARKAGRVLIASPASARAAFEPQPLVPGAAVSIGLTSGTIAIGSVGTVAYSDGPGVWIFGHQLDAAGRRALFLQDAYVHTVVNNPVAVPDVSTYKLASPGNDVGTITSDGINAVAGRLGALPPNFLLRVSARDVDSGRRRNSLTRIADESDVGRPAGVSAFGLAATAAVAEAASGVLTGTPARQMGDMCMQVTLRELRKPMRFCNSYAVDGAVPNAFAGALAADVASAIGVIDSFRFGILHPTAVDVGVRVRRGVRQAFITDATGPRRARRGQRIAVRLSLRRTGTGVRSTRTIRLRVPPDVATGTRTIRLTGTPGDVGGDPNEDGDLSVVFEEETDTEDPGPDSVADVRDAFESLERFDGIVAAIGGGDEREIYRDPHLRISGDARVQLTIRR